MVTLVVTPVYAGILAFMYLYLAFAVIRRRYRDHISLGDGGDASFLRTMRAHGNFAEYVPIALLLMAMAELGATFTEWRAAAGQLPSHLDVGQKRRIFGGTAAEFYRLEV